jgi:hypothetical protein
MNHDNITVPRNEQITTTLKSRTGSSYHLGVEPRQDKKTTWKIQDSNHGHSPPYQLH